MRQSFFRATISALLLGSCSISQAVYSQDSHASQSAMAEADEATLNEARQFVVQIGNEIIRILVNKNKPLTERKSEFRKVLRSDFNINAIGKFALGRYWRIATDEQKRQYLELFEDSIVESYAAQFDNYSNEKLVVLGSRATQKGGILVQSHILRPRGGEPLKVDWQIFKGKDGQKIYDIIINGVSMSITQRSEYAAAIKSTGSIENFISKMRVTPHVTMPASANNSAA